jgi:hypothetical protein
MRTIFTSLSDTPSCSTSVFYALPFQPPNKPMTGGKYPQPIQTPQHVRILIPVASRKSIIGEEGTSQTIANRTIQESFHCIFTTNSIILLPFFYTTSCKCTVHN